MSSVSNLIPSSSSGARRPSSSRGVCWSRRTTMLPLKTLNALVGEPDSGLHRGRRCLHVALHPRYLGNLPLGLITHFNALVNTYVPELEGILAAYGKITLRSPDGQFFNEEAHIHLDVISEFWTLRPTVGSLLKGVVVKTSRTHVSVLVHGCFNVPCYRPADTEDQEWCGSQAKLGQVVRFTVLKTDLSQKIPFIVGHLQSASVLDRVMDDSPNRVESVSQAAFDSLTRSTAPKPTSDQVADPPGRLNGGNAAEDDDDEDSGIDRNESRKRKLEREENPPDHEESLAGPSETKKKKKKKKDKREREEDASAAMAVEASEPEIPPSPPKKKKKKKKKSKPEERESMNEEPSESFPVIKDKKKKRKQKEMGDETDGLNSEIPQDDEERQKLTQALLSSPSVTLNSKDKKKKRKKDGKALEALEAAQKKAELNEARVKEAERKKKEEEAAAEAKAKELEMMRLKQKEAAEARVREAEKKRKEEEEEAERKRKILEEERKKMEEDQKWAQEIATRFALKGPLNLKESKTVNATHPMSSSEDEATAPKPSPQSSKKAAPKPSPSKKAAPKRTRSKSVAKSSVTAAPATPAPTVQTDLSATVNAPETSVESQADLQHQLLASMSTKMGSGSKGRKKKSKSTLSSGNPASQLIQSICGTPVPVFKSTPSGKQSKLRSAAWATPTGNCGIPEKQAVELTKTDSVEDVKSSLQADLIASMLSKTTPKKKKK